MQWVVGDVFPDAVHGFVVADDVFVIIALPDGYTGRAALFVDLFGDGGFERTNDGWDRTGDGATELFRRGTACRAPTIHNDDSVNMVGHHDEFIQRRIRKMRRNVRPTSSHDFPLVIQPHSPIDDIAEQMRPILRANGHKIRPGLG
ncbi:MAG: hypothetical protein NNA22_12650, partial [Nitrospira sp.]|nr:hypothetical protein [Nitrospira sp.]